MMISGAALMGLQLAIIAFGPPWQFQAGNFILMGWGFYMIHGSLQVLPANCRWKPAPPHCRCIRSSSSWPDRGPIAYGFGIQNVGKVPALLTSAVVIMALGLACAQLLRQIRPLDAAAI